MEEDKYIEGFNDGFLIATHRPEAGQDLAKAYHESQIPYLEGVKDGIEEKQLERGQVQGRLDELSALRDRNLGQEKEMDM